MPDAITRPLTADEYEAALAAAKRQADEVYQDEVEALKNTVVVVSE